jgi:DNA adenine methylase
MKSIVKWAGGKTWLLPIFKKLYDGEVFIEPLCGGASISLGLEPKKAILSDTAFPLIALYRAIQQGFGIKPSTRNTQEHFLKTRSLMNEILRQQLFPLFDQRERFFTDPLLCSTLASMFYYLNRTCFNGLYRTNKKGEFNVPFGKYVSVKFIEDFSKYKELFKNWEFNNCDYTLTPYRENAFIYFDPPYFDSYTGYSSEEWGKDDHIRLCCYAHSMSAKNKVIISNSDTPFIRQLYKKMHFKIASVAVSQTIAAKSEDRTERRELLAFKGFKKKTVDEVQALLYSI